jgi:hypothetical protein
MLVYAPFALCFVTLRGVFMRFSELTYWRDATVPVPCFLLFLCFRKVTREIFLELDETKPEPPIFPDARRSPKESQRGGRDQPHQGVAPPPPLAMPGGGVGSLATLWHRLSAYIQPSEAETLNQSVFFLVKFRSADAIEDQFWGTEVSVPAPCRDGKVPPEPSPSTPSPPPHLHQRYCLPWWGGSSSPQGLRALPVAMWFTSLSHDVIYMWSWALYLVELIDDVLHILWCLLEPSSALKVIVWGNLVWEMRTLRSVALHMISVRYPSENSLE